MPTLKEKLAKSQKDLASPRLEKVVVSTGVGKIKDQKKLDLIADRLAKITGQKAAPRPAKKSIASFKSRQGDIVGFAVTLRGKRMHGFLEKLFGVAIPRIRDFRGFEEKSVDNIGNLTLGLREHTIFPETADEDIKDIFGLAITLVATAKNRAEALAFFRALDFPFKKSI
ncbi:MAG: 50S ribosomal protein L5 [Candidatus Vogelbacteria bacterium]|nr:50S ribosomal protein L5 [Candidatus Vogelbacteria bacterium]